MRLKEDAQDYRYFPDPDLMPVVIDDELIEKLKKELPELPIARAKRFAEAHGLPEYDSLVLTAERELADYYEITSQVSGNHKGASNWSMTELLRELNSANRAIADSPVSPTNLGNLILLIDKGTISGKIAKTIFAEMWASGKTPEAIMKEKNLTQISDTGAIEKIIDEVLNANPSQVADYRGGRTKLFGFFVGAVMKASKGQANPEVVNKLLTAKLNG